MNVHVGPQMKHNTLFDSKTVNVKKKPSQMVISNVSFMRCGSGEIQDLSVLEPSLKCA